MTGRRRWSDVRDRRLKDDAARRSFERAKKQLAQELGEYSAGLKDLRKARNLTQRQLARTLGVSQAQVSRVENQTDLYLSTLRSYVEAMGGELRLSVVLPDMANPIEVDIAEVTTVEGDIAEVRGAADAALSDPAIQELQLPTPLPVDVQALGSVWAAYEHQPWWYQFQRGWPSSGVQRPTAERSSRERVGERDRDLAAFKEQAQMDERFEEIVRDV